MDSLYSTFPVKDNVKAVFFDLVRAGLWEDCDEFQDSGFTFQGPVEWEKVYQLAEEQSVVGVVLAGIERYKKLNLALNLDQELLLQWIGEAQIQEQQNRAMNLFIERLVGRMREAGIYTLLVKGQGVAHCYDTPLWRSCGDVDLFLSDDNYEKAKRFLIPFASTVDDEGIKNKHLGLTIDGFAVELHGTLYSGLSTRIDSVLDEIKSDTFYGGNVRSWLNGNTQVFLMGINNDIIYVFTHILQHFYKGGIGIRQICDWCRLLWRYRSELDLRVLESRMMRMGLMSEWKAFGAFAVEYLGMPVEAMPFYSANAKWKKKADKICSFILEVGNFGNKRDMSYFNEKSYLMQKVISLGRRCGDLIRHAKIFPLDSMRFFPRIMFNGLRSAAKGE